jgi:hypothetical protein
MVNFTNTLKLWKHNGMDRYNFNLKYFQAIFRNIYLDFNLLPCSERCVISSGRYPGVWILYANVSEHSVYSIFIGMLVWTNLFIPTILWRWNRRFRNFGIQTTDAGESPRWKHTTIFTFVEKLLFLNEETVYTIMCNIKLLIVFVSVRGLVVEITTTKHKFAPLLYSYMLAPTCFGSSLPSSGSFWIRLSYVKIQIHMVVYHTVWLRGLCIVVSWFSLLCFPAETCRSQHIWIKQWCKFVHCAGYFYYV